jgi:hypothetical protein
MRRLIMILIFILGVFCPIGLAWAAAPIFSNFAAEYQFAERMNFAADVAGDTSIASAKLFVQSGSQPPYALPADPFAPGSPVTVTASLDLNEIKLIPFSTITYWWEATDEAGQTGLSPRQSFAYVDNRFEWQELADGPARVHWYQGDSGFGAAAASVAGETLPKIQQQIGVDPPAPLDVYIYASVDDLRQAVELAGRDWLGGQARPELGVVLVAIAPDDSARLNMRRDIPHELSHLMTFVATAPNYASMPRWLDEGLATLNEGEPNAMQALAVQDAALGNRLISLTTLCGVFPTGASDALLAYGQSRNVVQRIIDQYGSAGIQALLAAYRDGATCAGGVERALNVPLNDLDAQWRAALPGASGGLSANPVASTASTGVFPWLVLIAAVALPLVVVLAWRVPKKHDKLTR